MTRRIVIPARLDSSRLPGKVLADLGGRPVLAHVIDAARASGLGEVWVASDADAVLALAAAEGAQVQRTRSDHPSGSDRIAEVAAAQAWPDDDVLLNLQGDEPFMPPALLATVVQLLESDPLADWATLATPIHSVEEWANPACVKVVRAAQGQALYFSRAPIPHPREVVESAVPAAALRHIGLYAYRVGKLAQWCATPPTPLESLEKLEQLRALELGMRIQVGVTDQPPPPGIDTPADLARAQARMSTDHT